MEASMSDFIHLNSVHLNYLEPLLKWRVLDLESLRKECVRAPTYKNFHRIIRKLEKQKILEGYRDPFNRKKYVYLSPFGEGQLSLDENPTALSKDTLIHDIKVTEITKAMLAQGWLVDAELEHRIHDKRNFRTTYKIIPDAVLHGSKGSVNYKIALELELSRKNNQRIVEKASQYLQGSQFNYVLYIFPKTSLLEKYVELLSEKFEGKGMERFMFFYDEKLNAQSSQIKDWEGEFKGRKLKMGELFSQPMK
jgi:DNA-binding Lrp family transcriptional regulator